MERGVIKISGEATRRKWAVYVIKAIPKNEKGEIYLYAGKTGDNREGCNPVVSRLGNHFSFNKGHSQIRNKISEEGNQMDDYDYELHYLHISDYKINQKKDKDIVNEFERRLNKAIQADILNKPKFILLNPYQGKSVKKVDREIRKKLLNQYQNNEIVSFSNSITNNP